MSSELGFRNISYLDFFWKTCAGVFFFSNGRYYMKILSVNLVKLISYLFNTSF